MLQIEIAMMSSKKTNPALCFIPSLPTARLHLRGGCGKEPLLQDPLKAHVADDFERQ
jgi:hypothetical protein